MTPNQRYSIFLEESNSANSGDPIGESNSCHGVEVWKFTRSNFIHWLYFFFSPFTMGSISLQSTQVTAKNSIKIKSLCLGIKFELVAEEETGGETATVAAEGMAVAEIFFCVVTQANKSKAPKSTNK